MNGASHDDGPRRLRVLAEAARPLPASDLLIRSGGATPLFVAALLLAGAAAPADGVRPSAEAEYVPELALLTWGQARAAEGHRGLYKVVLDSRPGDSDRFIAYDCKGPQGDQRTVWLRLGETPADTMVVEAQMELVWHGPSKDGVFPGHWEYRLLDAVRVK